MKLNLIFGKSGSGKSSYIYEDIKQNINNKNIFLIVPEQCNLSTERKLLNALNKDSIINVEVLTLKRMAFRVINQVKGEYTKLTNVGRNLILYNSLVNRKKDLNFLSKNEKNLEVVLNAITEFKKHNITIEKLENINIKD